MQMISQNSSPQYAFSRAFLVIRVTLLVLLSLITIFSTSAHVCAQSTLLDSGALKSTDDQLKSLIVTLAATGQPNDTLLVAASKLSTTAQGDLLAFAITRQLNDTVRKLIDAGVPVDVRGSNGW